ncbi:MAG: hypothetical protein ACTS6J_01245, partial [Burkholderiales bacterium]
MRRAGAETGSRDFEALRIAQTGRLSGCYDGCSLLLGVTQLNKEVRLFSYNTGTMPRIVPERLLSDLRTLRSIGAQGIGVVRPAFSAKDMEARRWLA